MPAVRELGNDLPIDKRRALAAYLAEKFSISVTARKNQIDDNLLRWEKNYDAIPAQKIRTVPFQRASNFMPGLIKMHTDILGARVLGIIFGPHPFWRVKSVMAEAMDHKILEDLQTGINYLWENELMGFELTDQIVNESLQQGTLILKGLWSDEVTTYLKDDAFLEKERNGMDYEPIAFEDFWPYPITARSSRHTEIMFHRIRLTEREVQSRVAKGTWSKSAADLLFRKSEVSGIDQARAESTGITLTPDVSYPYSAVECWLDYDFGDKRPRPIVVVINPSVQGEDSILKAYYNFMPYGERPFIDFKPMPRKGRFFGWAVPEILEQDQEEIAQIHNARRDANTISNIPSFKKKRYANVPNPSTDWYPGCIIELDDMDDLEFIQMGGNYNAMIDEEQFSMSLAERKVGISPSMQGFGAGQSAGKRGIYSTGGTLALLSEGNKRLDIYIRRLRYPFHRLGRATALAYNQFAPNYWNKFGEKGVDIGKAFRTVDAQGGLLYDLSASEASANREIDRQSLLQMGNTMAVYYQRIIELTGLIQQMPPDSPIRAVAIMVLGGARDLANRLLFSFDIPDRAKLVPDIGALLGASSPGGPAGGPPAGPGAPGALRKPQLEDVRTRIAAVTG